MKQKIEDGNGNKNERTELQKMIISYKGSYGQLKEYKTEIEHLQHLLEAARMRLTRDFEHWYENVYEETSISSALTYPISGALSKTKVLDKVVLFNFQGSRNQICSK